MSALVMTSMMIVGGTIGGVAAVGLNLRKAFRFKGHDNWVLVTERGATAEKDSSLPVSAINAVSTAADVKRHSAEVVAANMVLHDGRVDIVQLRGLEDDGFQMHGLELIEGRMPQKGTRELIVGDALRQHLPWLTVGATVTMVNSEFTCVGVFRAPGFLAGEVWTTRAAFQLNPMLRNLSDIYLETSDEEKAKRMADKLSADRALGVQARSESAFYGTSVKDFDHLNQGLTLVFLLVVTGAALASASLLALFQQRRLSELCVLRALGFRATSVAMLIIYETQLLVLTGGAIGIVTVAALLRGYTAYSVSAQLTSVTFRAPISWQIGLMSLGLVFAIGLAGSIIPIVRMMRTQITRGLREE